MTFGERMKKLRLEKGITQEKLGNIVGVSDRVIGYYESDDRFPKDELILKKLADYFDTSVDYLLGRTEKNIWNEPMQIAASTRNGIDLADICDSDKETLMNLFKIMKEKNKNRKKE